ncbi:uncharacterized protein F5147DRAFT_580703 [Suillus discolor]|uniref:Uncharacterized protein n=1 Tax=Suillus discolor TaxID=1912936 RepID=A0A9P7F3R0_9AGAM|nr:uncharacterized protein F5147DRAFT_580703 [Suillus discolor]KAG2103135.1 hypothetical protein F5147DRAFT_580703 [Suillus discolor]
MHFVRFSTYIASCLSVTRAFSVTVGTPTQCDPLKISWTGGQAPFEIHLTPYLKPYQNASVPASAFKNGVGSYSIPQLTLSAGTTFLLTMSDAAGFGSGGTTNQLTVGNSGNNDCNTQDLSPQYMFWLTPTPSPMTQCSSAVATNGAVLPITIAQLIPGGQPTVLYSNEDTFTSSVNVTGGTSLLYFVTDSKGRQGGASGLQQVLGSSNFTCLSANSPSSTAGISATATTTASPSSSSSNTSSKAALIAGAVGSAVVLTALVILGMCLWRKRRASRIQPSKTTYFQLQNTNEVSLYSEVLPSPSSSPYPVSYHMTPVEHMAVGARPAPPLPRKRDPAHFSSPVEPGSQSISTTSGNVTVRDPPTPFRVETQISPDTDSLAMHGASGSQSTASASAYQPPTQIIVHTDADDVVPDRNGLVELPPQYSDHRENRTLESKSAS